MPRLDLIALGLNAVDYLLDLRDFPREDEKINFLSWRRLPGGQAATAAVTVARLGFRSAYLGAVADDENGDFARREFERDRVDLSHLLVRRGGMSQFACILVNRRHHTRTILWNKSADIRVKPSELDLAWLAQAKVFHCDGHNLPAEIEAARFCRKHGITTVIDTEHGDPAGLRRLFRHIDHIILPADAADRFIGRRCRDDRERCRALLAFGAKAAVLTMGAQGSLGCDGARFVSVPACRVKVRDTTGAGDVFHGAYLAGLLMNLDLETRLRFASLIAALKCREFGARGGVPTASELVKKHRALARRYLGAKRWREVKAALPIRNIATVLPFSLGKTPKTRRNK